jgi:hypothetical protein
MSFGHSEKSSFPHIFIHFGLLLYFIVWNLSQIVVFGQLCATIQQKLMTANRKLAFFKITKAFLSVFHPKLSISFQKLSL